MNLCSHNVIIRDDHTHSAFEGLVVGYNNEISVEFASVTGGSGNIASGPNIYVTRGVDKEASILYSSLSGGMGN